MEKLCNSTNSAGELPNEIYQATEDGDQERVIEWLNKSGNINDSRSEKTILSLACQFGHADLIRHLVLDRVLSINTNKHGVSPLYKAAACEQTQCLRTDSQHQLNDSNTKKKIDSENTTALMEAASSSHWESVKIIIREQKDIQEEELKYVLQRTLDHKRWDVLLALLQLKCDFDETWFHGIIRIACDEDRWDVISEILKREIHMEGLPFNVLLLMSVRKRDWKTAGYLLSLLSSEIVLDSTLADAILKEEAEVTDLFLEEECVYISEHEKTVDDLLNKNHYEDVNLDAAMLVAAIGGTTEGVAHLLLNRHHSTNRCVIINALFLSSKHNRLELLPDLLEYYKDIYSYKVLSQARHIAAKERHMDAVRIIFRALEAKTKHILG